MMWIAEHQLAGQGAMNVPFIWRLCGPLDTGALRTALRGLVARHETLRSTFEWADGETQIPGSLRQCVGAAPPAELSVIDLRHEPDPLARAEERMLGSLTKGIDVSSASPMLAELYRLAPEHHLLMCSVHHQATDAWSNVVLWRDLAALYSTARGGSEPGIPAEPATFRRFAATQNKLAGGPDGERHAAFWRERLAGLEYVQLRPPVQRPPGQHRKGANVWFEVDRALTAQLQTLAGLKGATLPEALQAAFYLVLRRLCGQSAMAIGTVLANRDDPQWHDTVGYLSNMVTVAVSLPDRPSFSDALSASCRALREAAPHSRYPFLSVLMDPTMPPDVMKALDVIFQTPPLPEAIAPAGGVCWPGLTAEPYPVPDGLSGRCELELMVTPMAGGLEGLIRYAPDRYDREFAEHLAGLYQQVLAVAVADAEAVVP